MPSRTQKYLGSFYGISVTALAARLRCAHKDLDPAQREVLSVHPPFLLNDFPLPNEFLFQKHFLNSHDCLKYWAYFGGGYDRKVCASCACHLL